MSTEIGEVQRSKFLLYARMVEGAYAPSMNVIVLLSISFAVLFMSISLIKLLMINKLTYMILK